MTYLQIFIVGEFKYDFFEIDKIWIRDFFLITTMKIMTTTTMTVKINEGTKEPGNNKMREQQTERDDSKPKEQQKNTEIGNYGWDKNGMREWQS
jgi:hypothetical protein